MTVGEVEVRCSFSVALVHPLLPSDDARDNLPSPPPRVYAFKDCNQISERIISSSSMLLQLESKRKEGGRS